MSRSSGFGPALCCLVVLLMVCPLPTAATVIHVKWDATGAGDGTSWADAFTDLQSALSSSVSGDTIWVAAGTYTPTNGTDRAKNFALKNGVALFGGFAGLESALPQRVIRQNPTILSGEIGVLGKDDNCYHVLVAQNVDSTTVLDGFIVSDGNASGSDPNDRGGGLIVLGGNPTVRNAVFKRNTAVLGGGASISESRTTITNVWFSGNFAAYGGGMFIEGGGHETITNTSIAGDSVGHVGAAIYNVGSFPLIVNSIVWANKGVAQVISLGGGVVTWCYSIIEGSGGSGAWRPWFGIDCGHNMDVDPLLLSVLNADLHLMPDSPAIDAGDGGAPNLPTTDIDSDPRIGGSWVDIGADEYGDATAVAHRTGAPVPTITSVFPNPFNPTVTVSFEVDERREVIVTVYDVSGRLVRVLREGVTSAGSHRVVWDATDREGGRVASGVYFIEVQSDAWRDSRKVILAR